MWPTLSEKMVARIEGGGEKGSQPPEAHFWSGFSNLCCLRQDFRRARHVGLVSSSCTNMKKIAKLVGHIEAQKKGEGATRLEEDEEAEEDHVGKSWPALWLN